MDVIVIGAGAAGLLCAREAALRGRRVAVLDHSDEAGRKILVSGGGKCNFTNLNASPEAYVSANMSFCTSALARYPPADFIRLVDEHGIPYHEKTRGQLFCDRTANEIRDLLVNECKKAQVKFLMGNRIENVSRGEGAFHVQVGGTTLSAPHLVIATGGLSCTQTGATGFGLDLARTFGLAIVPPEPALVGLSWNPQDLARWKYLAGVTIPDVTVTCNGVSFRESLLLTHTGLSGPAILQASLYWRPETSLSIDLAPDTDLPARLISIRRSHGSRKLDEVISETLPRRFAWRFAAEYLPQVPLARLSDSDIEAVAQAIHGWRIAPSGTEGFEKAEVTRGGVDTRELSSKTMEATKVPGLFFIGEVVDVTGQLGGYNLQWAWSSGAAAGRAI